MKKYLIILFFSCVSVVARAQVGGIQYESIFSNSSSSSQYSDPYYNPYQNGGSYQTQQPRKSQPQARVIRTTAYSVEGNTYIKHPIKVREYYEHGLTKYAVIEVCQSTGYGVQWVKLNSGMPVSECMPMLSNNPLESQFTHKANVMGTIYYFDL